MSEQENKSNVQEKQKTQEVIIKGPIDWKEQTFLLIAILEDVGLQLLNLANKSKANWAKTELVNSTSNTPGTT